MSLIFGICSFCSYSMLVSENFYGVYPCAHDFEIAMDIKIVRF